MKFNNKGFTLIELIVVMSVLVVLTTGGVTINNRLRYTDTLRAAKDIDMAMNKVRVETMSKGVKQYLYLYLVEDAIYMKISPKADATQAGLDEDSGQRLLKHTNITYKISGISEQKLLHNQSIGISFERSSGAFDADYEYIKLNNAGNTSIIHCIKETGRHWVE
jgi:prepilin-type N-terminal cleavage/methylation domain-containing protein